jgi:hypothetical protein
MKDVTDLLSTVAPVVLERVAYHNVETYWPAADTNPSNTKNETDFAHWID